MRWRELALVPILARPLPSPALADSGGVPRIEVLSNRADLISGGDALVRIVARGPVRVDLGGADVTASFAARPDGTLTGLVTGLSPGANVLTARQGGRAGRLTVTDHPRGGPVFSGPQVRPWRCQTEEDRLDRANGHHRNQVLWTNGGDGSALEVMDRWLAAVEADGRAIPLPDKVVRHRPPQAVDACWIDGAKVTDQAACDRAYPYKADTRVASGEGPASDLLKCRLKPLRRADYGVRFTGEQWSRLRAAFLSGVCDIAGRKATPMRRPLTLALALTCALASTGVASADVDAAAPAALPADPFFAYDRPAQYGVHRERVTVPLRDGGHLACDLHRPAAPDGTPAPGRFPGIVYDYNAYNQLDALGRAAAYFVERGYAAAVCNARGSGGSPGHLDPFSAQEQRDNYDLIEWLAARPWSTGRIGQTGVSYGGHSALLVAVNKPPHLAAIIPVDGISDWYENTIYRGGIYSARIRDWQRSVAPDTLRTYAEHPLYDDFWRERSVKSRWKDLDVPVLEIAGWYDRYRQGMVDNFRARRHNVWLVAGPWVHGWPAGQPADIGNGAYLAWWDRWLARRPGAPLPAAKVTSYETPGTGWGQYASWPPPGARRLRLGLGADGALAPDPGAAATRSFEVNTEPGAGGPGQRLSFTTGPLERDVVLAGEVEAKVRASFTASDGNIAVVVEDVAPDGTATRVTQGWLKASHRRGHERPATVRSGRVYDLDLRTWPAHHRVAAGHTLRVTVSSDDYPEIDSDAPAGQVGLRLGHGGSAVTLTYAPAARPS